MLLLIGMATAALVLIVGASPASAQYANQNFVSCTPASGGVGTSITCQAGYFDAGSTVTWVLNSTPVNLGSTTAGADGTAAITFTVPAGVAAGAHSVSASGYLQGASQSIQTITAAITVVGATGGSTGGTSGGNLPVTGSSNVGLYAGVAAALIAGGGMVLMASRQRRPVDTH